MRFWHQLLIYVLVDDDSDISKTNEKISPILGYYSLASITVPLDEFPDSVKKRYNKYFNTDSIDRRMATSQKYKRQGFGILMLIDAIRMAYKASLIVPIPMLILKVMHEIVGGSNKFCAHL